MRVEEVSQDEKYYVGTNVRDIYYALDEDGNYQQVVSVGWEPKNEALELTWENINEEAEAIKQEVLAGLKSPLAYFMKIRLFSISLLSAYTQIPKRVIRKHLKAKKFQNMDSAYLEKYAESLNITVEELKNFNNQK